MTDVLSRLRPALAGRYTIEHELGSGATATVYRARDERHGRSVAIKVLNPELGTALGSSRFLREIDTLARLQHPHILPLFDSGDADGLLWFAMPYVAGQSLRDRLEREHQLPIEEATTLACEVADALAYAHQNGVVHRDVKPENILLTAGHALIADFGIMRAADDATRITQTGVSMGTPEYMSPEQVSGQREIDGRADVYALGCVLFEMLAGRAPFVGPTIQSIAAQHLTMEPPALAQLRPTVPPHVARALERALAKAPADRFATATDFANALRRGSASAKPAQRRIAIAATVVGIALAVVMGAMAWRGRSHVTGAAQSILVVPFAPAAPDTALSRLGRELALTLSLNLDGVGGIKTVHPLAVLSQTAEQGGSYSLEQARALAARLGARSVVHGSLVRVGERVRVDLALFDGDGATAVVQASATSDINDINALTDSATFAFLRQVWRVGSPPSPSLAAVTTRSIPALRAFLEGERNIAQGNFVFAAKSFQRAIEADSTFWFAYWRHAYALSWHGQPVDSLERVAFESHRDSFPAPDRALIEAGMNRDSLSGVIDRLRAVTERYPDYWPAWMRYQDVLVHSGAFVGFTLDDSRAALERLVVLNPELVPAWTHLLWVASHQRDSAATGRAVRELARLHYDSLSIAESSLNGLGLSRYIDYLVRNNGRPDSAQISQGVADLVGFHGPFPAENIAGEILIMGFAVAELDGDHLLLRSAASAPMKMGALRAMAGAHARRGAWDSALVAAAAYADLKRQPESVQFGYQMAAVGEWLGATDSSSTKQWRQRVRAVESRLSPQSANDVQWLDGLVAASRRDTVLLNQMSAALARSDQPDAKLLGRSLDAFATDLRGDGALAGRQLANLEWEIAQRGSARPFGARHPFFMAVNRLTAARRLTAAGDGATAERLLRFPEAVLTSRLHEQAHRALEGMVWFERGRIEEGAGRPDAAVSAYRRVLEDVDQPVSGLRWMIDAAQNGITKLRR